MTTPIHMLFGYTKSQWDAMLIRKDIRSFWNSASSIDEKNQKNAPNGASSYTVKYAADYSPKLEQWKPSKHAKPKT